MMIALIVVVGLLVYAWILYPGLMLQLGKGTHPRPLQGGELLRPSLFSIPSEGTGVGSFPPVSILFSAHNEAAVILRRLENLAALDYPAERLRIFVGIDGGTDRTADIALEWARSHPAVHVIVSPENLGKMAMLKKLVESAGRELLSARCLLVFTDANTFFAPDALTRLVAPFSDPEIGGVCGRLVFVGSEKKFEQKPSKSAKEENCIAAGGGEINSSLRSSRASVQISSTETDEPVYWNLETRLKEAESRLDSCLGANGAIYAIRYGLFPAEIPDSTIVDDFVIGMKVREQGYRMVFEPAAVATEDLPETVRDEWRRRVRIGAGAFQALALCRSCLSPRYGLFAGMFWSHKVLRWFTPHLLLVGTLLLSCQLAQLINEGSVRQDSAAQQLINLAGGCFLAAGVLAACLKRVRKGAGYFLVMQSALFVGFLRYCRGGLKGTWERTERGDFTTSV